jgi:hypothetical protein
MKKQQQQITDDQTKKKKGTQQQQLLLLLLLLQQQQEYTTTKLQSQHTDSACRGVLPNEQNDILEDIVQVAHADQSHVHFNSLRRD